MFPELAKLLVSSVEECLEDEIAVSFSGGIDSTLLAKVAKNNCDVYLFSAGTKDSDDLNYSKIIAEELGLNLETILFDEELVLKYYEEIYRMLPAQLLKIEILIPIYACAKKAREKNLQAILIGSGAEELFVGYHRYYTYFNEGKDLNSILMEEFKTLPKRDAGMILRVCKYAKIEARFPFLNKNLADYVFSIPLSKRMEETDLKKGLLRDAAKFLKIPKTALERRKKAAQYGSGVHKILMKNSDFIAEKYPEKI
ncbi:MAG: asparagine synthase C-terminal domain-containing protein [Candidatus Micrarchaeia archaeon]